MKKKRFKIEEKMIAQIKFFEVLYVITDPNGNAIFTGSKEMAVKFSKILNAKTRRLK